jgi:hypothetical protein
LSGRHSREDYFTILSTALICYYALPWLELRFGSGRITLALTGGKMENISKSEQKVRSHRRKKQDVSLQRKVDDIKRLKQTILFDQSQAKGQKIKRG